MELRSDSVPTVGLRHYLDEIVGALGLTGRPYCLDLGTPLSAYLALGTRLPSFPHCDAALLWNERHGWAGALETDAGTTLTVLTCLGGDVHPHPDTVARFALSFVTGDYTRTGPR